MFKKMLIIAGLVLAGASAQAAVPGMSGTATKAVVVAAAKEQVQSVRYYRRYYVAPRRHVYVAPRVYVRPGRRHTRVILGF